MPLCHLQMWYEQAAPTKSPPTPLAAESGVDFNACLLALCKKNKTKGKQQAGLVVHRSTAELMKDPFLSLIKHTEKRGFTLKRSVFSSIF